MPIIIARQGQSIWVSLRSSSNVLLAVVDHRYATLGHRQRRNVVKSADPAQGAAVVMRALSCVLQQVCCGECVCFCGGGVLCQVGMKWVKTYDIAIVSQHKIRCWHPKRMPVCTAGLPTASVRHKSADRVAISKRRYVGGTR